MAYDPFTHRKQLPDFPSSWTVTSPAEVANIGNRYRTPGSTASVSNTPNPLPDLPQASGPQAAIPPFPADVPAAPDEIPAPDLAPNPNDEAADHPDDAVHAGNVMGQFDDLLKSIDSIGAPPAQDAPVVDQTDPAKMSPVGARPADRSWMFRPAGSSIPPVTFNKTGSGEWGSGDATFNDTHADWTSQLPANTGPAPSTVRYYDRAQARAEGGSRLDANRIRRLPLRINARPNNG